MPTCSPYKFFPNFKINFLDFFLPILKKKFLEFFNMKKFDIYKEETKLEDALLSRDGRMLHLSLGGRSVYIQNPVNNEQSWRPKFSLQHHKERNCGQQCVSMITHLPVEIICRELGKWKGTFTSDVSGMLRWFGVDCDVVKTPFRSGMILPKLAVLHVKHHWCVYHSGYIYDSCLGIFPIEFDSRRIKGYISVAEPKV